MASEAVGHTIIISLLAAMEDVLDDLVKVLCCTS